MLTLPLPARAISWQRLALLLTVAGLTCAAGPDPVLRAVQRGEFWGYADPRGRIRLPPRYQMAEDFTPEGLGAVVDDQGWAYIDRKGRVVVRPLAVDNGPDPFSEGLARFAADGRIGYFDARGQVVIEPRFDFAFPFAEGRAVFCRGCRISTDGEHGLVEGGAWGYIDREGRVVIAPRFESARSFDAGRASVRLAGKLLVIDRRGEVMPNEPSLKVLLDQADALLHEDLDQAREEAAQPGMVSNTARYEQARDLFRQVLEQAPDNTRAKEGLAASEEMLQPYIPVQHVQPPILPEEIAGAAGGSAEQAPDAESKQQPWEIRRRLRRADREGMAYTGKVFAARSEEARDEAMRIVEEAKGELTKNPAARRAIFDGALARLRKLQEGLDQSWKGHGPQVFQQAAQALSEAFGLPPPAVAPQD